MVTYNRTIEILVLCSGNICRSPLAEAFLAYQLATRGVPAQVSSAGLYKNGQPASVHGVTVAARKGHDLSRHRSRVMTADMLEAADLILGMERMHIREAVVRANGVFPRSFTLKEIVRRGEQVGPRGQNEAFGHWLARVDAGRHATDHLGSSAADDVADPIGRSIDRYEQTAAALDDLVRRLCDLVWWAPAPAEPDPGRER